MGTRVDARTRFRWFSVTKLVTAACVMRAFERGRIDLDADVRDRLGWFRPAQKITARQLLGHRSGLASPNALGWVHPPGAALRDPATLTRETFARYRTLRAPPGAVGRYSNLGYLILGALLDETEGGFVDTARAFLDAAGATRAGFDPTDAARGHERGLALRTAVMAVLFGRRTPRLVAYVREGWVGLTPFAIEGCAYGGLIGSLDDLVGLGRAFLSPGDVLGADSLRAMVRPTSSAGPAIHGLGFFIDGDGWVGHTGEAGGYRAELRIQPARGIGIAALANSGTATTAEVVQQLKES